MSRHEVLLLLQDLLRNSVVSKTDPDDYSGTSTVYLVDQEQLMKNIEAEIEKEVG